MNYLSMWKVTFTQWSEERNITVIANNPREAIKKALKHTKGKSLTRLQDITCVELIGEGVE